MVEGGYMKILKIEAGKGFFCSNGRDWKQIDEIDKDGLMSLLNYILKENDIEMDEYKVENLSNQAQQIIYQSIYDKFEALRGCKDKFKDESDRLYMDAIAKYSI